MTFNDCEELLVTADNQCNDYLKCLENEKQAHHQLSIHILNYLSFIYSLSLYLYLFYFSLLYIYVYLFILFLL